MPTLPIVLWPDPRLALRCAEVDVVSDAIRRLAADMLETMYAAPGRGLAAPQVGVLQRIFVMDVSWKDGPRNPMVFVDPEVVWRADTVAKGAEGCLSIPGVLADVERATSIGLVWTDLDGKRAEATLEGFAAICAQHELDHLDGIVTLDRLSTEERARVLT